jgi:hypothetical protein
MNKNNFINEDDLKNKYKMCNICGSIQHVKNYARHLKSKYHIRVDYINNNRFEIERMNINKNNNKNEIIIIK